MSYDVTEAGLRHWRFPSDFSMSFRTITLWSNFQQKDV